MEEEDEEEEEQRQGEGGAASPPGEQRPKEPSYFDDQRGRVMRGSSFSTSLDVSSGQV